MDGWIEWTVMIASGFSSTQVSCWDVCDLKRLWIAQRLWNGEPLQLFLILYAPSLEEALICFSSFQQHQHQTPCYSFCNLSRFQTCFLAVILLYWFGVYIAVAAQ